MTSHAAEQANDEGDHTRLSSRTAIDRLYDRLIRDFCARVVPGLVLLLSLAMSIVPVGEVANAVERASVWMWLPLLGASWLVSFALLAIGRRFNLALHAPEAVTDEQYWAAEERFRSRASRRRHAAYERLVTIRDGAAASSVSLFLSLATLSVDFVVDVHLHEDPWNEIRNDGVAVVVAIVVGVALQMVHRDYVRKAWQSMTMNEEDSALHSFTHP